MRPRFTIDPDRIDVYRRNADDAYAAVHAAADRMRAASAEFGRFYSISSRHTNGALSQAEFRALTADQLDHLSSLLADPTLDLRDLDKNMPGLMFVEMGRATFEGLKARQEAFLAARAEHARLSEQAQHNGRLRTAVLEHAGITE